MSERHEHQLNSLPLEVLNLVLSRVDDPQLVLALEELSRQVHSARPLLHGHLQTTIKRGWSNDITQVARLASLYRQLDRVENLSINIDKLPEHFFDIERCRHLTSLSLTCVTTVPACVSACSALQHLALAGQFTLLPDALCQLSALTHLAVSTALPEWLQPGLLLPAALTQLPQLATLELDVDGAVGWTRRNSGPSGAFSCAISRLLLHSSTGGLRLTLPWPALPQLATLCLSGTDLPRLPGLQRLLADSSTQHTSGDGGLSELRCCFADAGAFGPAGLIDLLASLPAPAAAQEQDKASDRASGSSGASGGPLGRLRCLHLEAPATGLREPPAAAAAAAALQELFGGRLAGLTSLSVLLNREKGGAQVQQLLGNCPEPFYEALPRLSGLQRLTLVGLSGPPPAATLASLAALTALSVTCCGCDSHSNNADSNSSSCFSHTVDL